MRPAKVVNRKVVDSEVEWVNEGTWSRGKSNRTWVISEVSFTDTNGRLHHCPGGGCAYPKETNEAIISYFKGFYGDESHLESLKQGGWWNENSEKLYQAVKNGEPIIDEFGELLPQFNSKLG